MLFRRLSIQWKITLLAGLCLLGVVSLLSGLSVFRTQTSTALVKESSTRMLDEAAQARLRSRGEVQAMRIQRYIMDAYQYGKGFSRQVMFLRDQAQKRFLDAYDLREDLTRQVKTALEGNPELLGLYVAFEPNALDGKDQLFAGQAEIGSNDAGRFSLYWSQATPGQLESEATNEAMLADTTPGPSGAPYNAWFTCPKTTGQPCVLDPYFDEAGGRKLLMTSIAFPLELDGKIVGVMGLDISLEKLQEISRQGAQELYDGQGKVSIISAAGLLAGHSADAKLLGKKLQEVYPQQGAQLLQSIASDREQVLRQDAHLRVIEPLQPIPGSKPWAVLLEVPEQTLLGPAITLQQQLDEQRTQGTLSQIGFGLIAVLIGLFAMWLTARGVTRPILGVAAMLRNIASGEGDLTKRLDYAGKDELGELAGWFNRFLDKLQPIIRDVKSSVHDARATADQSSEIASQTSAGMQQQFREVD
ncbi:HAMP domain-containing protein, partial [Pseudomonas sp. NY15181]|uniref:methyl-accepting chemotaxis protein n=1 Tax=Pseudomonas sp. NY15181 TaxID=3400349 RepID=UPI003A88ADF3